MAGRLTIRRVGHILPTLCLVVLLLFVGLVIWLSTIGLPGHVLRRIEQEAGAAVPGVSIDIKAVKLYPSSGLALKAEGVSLQLQQPDAAPASVYIRKAKVTFSISKLLVGELVPANMQIKQLKAELPLSRETGDSIQLNPLNLYVVWPRKGEGVTAEADANLQGIQMHAKFAVRNLAELISPESSDTKEESTTPATILAQLRPRLREFQKQIAQQHWENIPPPQININAAKGKDWVVHLNAQIPSYRLGSFCFLDSQLQARYEKNELTFHNLSFKTQNPDTRVRLQASYNLKSRELAFNTRSSAPVIRMLNDYLGQESPEVLGRIQALKEETPQIELNGTALFSEDYALRGITLRGKVEQQGFTLGDLRIKHLLLTFFMRDGSFNLDNARLEFPDGHITCAAKSENGTGHAELECSLPDETLLELIQELTGHSDLSLPAGLEFGGNLNAHISAEMTTRPFEPGKSRLSDLIPTMHSARLQFRTPDITYQGTSLQTLSVNLGLDGIDYRDSLNIRNLELTTRIDAAQSETEESALSDAEIDIRVEDISAAVDFSGMHLGHSQLEIKTTAAQINGSELDALQATASVDKLEFALDNPVETLSTSAVKADIHLESFTHAGTTAENADLQVDIPAGLIISEAWHSMQHGLSIEASIRNLTSAADFSATECRLSVRNTAPYTMQLKLVSQLDQEQLRLDADAELSDNHLLRLRGVNLHLPAASLLPLLEGEPLQELRLPRLVELRGNALFDTATNQLLDCHYRLNIPELIRVCNTVHVHKGLEIPLQLAVNGSFSTSPDGTMSYDADVKATHAEGVLDVHVSGNPVSDCHITGSNTIPVSIVNALIDDVDAHWIMRDFRCIRGVTRNDITDIDTIIRYDRGIYVYSRCKAKLYDMDFQLGVIRDKEDAQGNPTGEEYLRTDLGKDPFARIKEGSCEVEVLVQLDCKDKNGKPIADETRINLLNPDLLYDNRPWLKRQKIKGGEATSRITGEAVRFDIEKCIITLHKLKGTCYPAYAIGMYYAPLHSFLSDIELLKPARIETDYCLFPISSRCDIPMRGLIRAEASRGAGFRFLGTTIPLRNFSGFINISDSDVYLDRMNAQSWGGVLNGSLRIGFAGKHTTLDGYFVANNLNLKDITASYGVDFTPATCNGFIRFQAPKPDLDAVQAYGQVHLQDGDLMEIGLFKPIGALLTDMPNQLEKLQNSLPGGEKVKLPSWSGDFVDFIWTSSGEAINSVGRSALRLPFANHFLRYGIDEAFARFDIRNGHLISRDMKATGYNLDVGVQLDINLEDLTFKGDLWPRISSVPTVLISPVTLLSDFLIDINLYGDLLSPQWEFGLSKKLKGQPPSLSPEPRKNAPIDTN